MAKIIITIEDAEEGLTLNAQSYPDFRDVVVPEGKEPWDAYTIAQKASLYAIDKVKEAIEDSGFDVEDVPVKECDGADRRTEEDGELVDEEEPQTYSHDQVTMRVGGEEIPSDGVLDSEELEDSWEAGSSMEEPEEPNQYPHGHEYVEACDTEDDCDDCTEYPKCSKERFSLSTKDDTSESK